MEGNEDTVKKYMDGFNEGNHEKILECLTDDVIWHMPGYFHLTGKEAFDKEIKNDNFEGPPTIQIIKMVEEDNIVIAEGAVRCKIKAGGLLDALFCEVFQMENGKIKHLTTYQMDKTVDDKQNKKLEIKTALQIQKPVTEVFEAIIDPVKMSNYFISKGSGRMEEGSEIIWQFPEFDGEFPVRVGKVIKDKYISYYWDMDGIELLVEMTITSEAGSSTLVTITEKSRNNDEAGISWLKGNTEGWANFLACLKAYLEYGINLRKGAFDFMSDKI
jgi:uncharacterized protein YndB with AHSA1/START domain/ketosteroid isomerase-like protein